MLDSELRAVEQNPSTWFIVDGRVRGGRAGRQLTSP